MPARTTLPPWERRTAHPRHPIGRTRRRWPRAYDGGTPEAGPGNRRYHREFEGERRRQSQGRRGVRRPLVLETLRQSPVRNGLIGLAVAGAATPIAVNRYQAALRNDPSHETLASTRQAAAAPATEQGLSEAYAAMETERSSADAERDRVVQEKVGQYAEYDLSREMAEDIYDMAREAGVDADVAFGLVAAESSFKNSSTSHVGAVGLTQLMPKTAAWLVPGTTVSDLRNQETNLRIGMKYLRQLIDKYDGNENLALTAYNRGPGTVDRILKRGGNPDNGYADFVRTGEVGRHKG